MTDYRRLRVALLGAGAVGSQVAALLLRHGDELADRAGAELELAGIAVRDVNAPRDVDLPAELFTTDAESLVLGADIVIELIGGIEPARSTILQAIGAGADVVTANKALLATHGPGCSKRPTASVPPCTTKPRPRVRSRSSAPCATRWRVTGWCASWASSTAPRTTSSIGWTARARTSPMCSPTRSASGTPRPTRPPMSRAMTPRRRPRSSRASPSTPRCRSMPCIARGSRRSPRR